MADLNSIFVSNLNADEKKAKSLFGKLIISLRKNNHMRIYALMSGVTDTKFVDNVITFVFSDKSSYEMINNYTDIQLLNNILQTIDPGITCELKCDEKVVFDEYKFKEFLKKEFDKILTIK